MPSYMPGDCSRLNVKVSPDKGDVSSLYGMIEKLFCKNERACLKMVIGDAQHTIALVPVAAVLVASIRLHALDTLLHTRYAGPLDMACEADFVKGEELGWFQHGSTILVFVPKGFTIDPSIQEGTQIKMGQVLMRLPQVSQLG